MNETNMKNLPQTTPVVHLGVDVAKDELVADCHGTVHRFENNPKGIARLLKAITRTGMIAHLVCEATAGYERPLVDAAMAGDIRISVIPPQRVRSYAKSGGHLAKSDPLDALLLSRYGAAHADKIKPLGPKDSTRRKIDDLMRARGELMDSLHRERNRKEHHQCPLVLRIFKNLEKQYAKRIKELDAAVARLIAEDSLLSQADAKLREVAGVGTQTSHALLAFMPELGCVGRRSAAALAGLAPYDNDSGKKQGKRFIQGGRIQVRRSLHMAALVATKHNPVLKKFYESLLKAGKPFKVAIVAVTRKLLIHLNTIMAKILENPVAV